MSYIFSVKKRKKIKIKLCVGVKNADDHERGNILKIDQENKDLYQKNLLKTKIK